MERKELKYTLAEIAVENGYTLADAVSKVCDCDLTNGWRCKYHQNPDIKLTLNEWNELACGPDQYDVIAGQARKPFNIYHYEELRKLLMQHAVRKSQIHYLEQLKCLAQISPEEAKSNILETLVDSGLVNLNELGIDSVPVKKIGENK